MSGDAREGVKDSMILDELFSLYFIDGKPHNTSFLSLNGTQNDSSWKTNRYLNQRIVIDVYLVTFLICFGFIGNALTIAVLCRERDRNSSTNWLLQMLAVVDTIYLIASIFIQPLKTIDEARWWPCLNAFSPYMDVYIWALASIAQTITVWTVVVLTVDRYVAVCRPYSAHLRTVRRAQFVMAGVVIVAIIYNIPVFLERRVSYDYPEGTGVAMSVKTTFSHNLLYSVFYKTICYFVTRSIGPLLLLLVLNSSLIHALRRIEHRRKDIVSKSSQHRENITLTLVVVVTIFIVCQLPDVVLRLIASQIHAIPGSQIPYRYRLMNSVTNFMLTLNSSINFFIYCLIGRKFRRILVQMFAGCCGDGKSPMSETFERQKVGSLPMEAMITINPCSSTDFCAINESHGRPEPDKTFINMCLTKPDIGDLRSTEGSVADSTRINDSGATSDLKLDN